MKILCCYTNAKLSTTALMSFGEHAPEAELVNVTGDWGSRDSMYRSQTQLWHEFRARWTGEEDLLLLKQTRPVTSKTISAFGKCSKLLCVSNGAKRYRAELQRKIPAADIAGDYCVWHLLEERLMKLWMIHQIEVCIHHD